MITKGWKKGLEKLEINGRIEIIHTKAFPKSTRIVRKILETFIDSRERPSINPAKKKIVIIMIIIIANSKQF